MQTVARLSKGESYSACDGTCQNISWARSESQRQQLRSSLHLDCEDLSEEEGFVECFNMF